MTEQPATGDMPIRDDDAVTTCSLDSTDTLVSALLEPTVALILSVTLLGTISLLDSPVMEPAEPLSLLPEASFVAVSPDPDSPDLLQSSTSHPKKFIQVSWSSLMFDSSEEERSSFYLLSFLSPLFGFPEVTVDVALAALMPTGKTTSSAPLGRFDT